MKIRTVPDPVLRVPARTVTLGDQVWKLIDRMVETARACENPSAVGLAAPQVGKSLRLFVWRPDGESDDWRAAVNPAIVARSGKQTEVEGCLSVPGRRQAKRRSAQVVLAVVDPATGRSRTETFVGFEARIVQHECDHLYGLLFCDPGVGR